MRACARDFHSYMQVVRFFGSIFKPVQKNSAQPGSQSRVSGLTEIQDFVFYII